MIAKWFGLEIVEKIATEKCYGQRETDCNTLLCPLLCIQNIHQCQQVPTTQKDVVMLDSSIILPLIALLINIFDVMTSPHNISKCATFSASHSSGEPEKEIPINCMVQIFHNFYIFVNRSNKIFFQNFMTIKWAKSILVNVLEKSMKYCNQWILLQLQWIVLQRNKLSPFVIFL